MYYFRYWLCLAISLALFSSFAPKEKEQMLFPFFENGKYGYKNAADKVIIYPVYDYAAGFFNGYATVRLNNKTGLLDKNAHMALPAMYDNVLAPQFDQPIETHYVHKEDSIIGVQKNGKWGFVNLKNETIIPFEYSDICCFSGGLAWVSKDFTTWGTIDVQNHVVLPCNKDYFKWHMPYYKGNAIAGNDLFVGVINTSGKILVPIKYEKLRRLNKDYFYVGKNPWQKTYMHVSTQGIEYKYNWYDTLPASLNISKAPTALPNYISMGTDYYYYRDETGKIAPAWALEKFITRSMIMFANSAGNQTYEDALKINCASLPWSLGRIMNPKNQTETFKKEVAFKILASERLRQITWKWAAPFYKKIFKTFSPYHKMICKEIAHYMKNYINHYNKKKMMDLMKNRYHNFASADYDGGFDPYRNISSFIDRLILVHKIVSVHDAKIWINKISNEMDTWD